MKTEADSDAKLRMALLLNFYRTSVCWVGLGEQIRPVHLVLKNEETCLLYVKLLLGLGWVTFKFVTH